MMKLVVFSDTARFGFNEVEQLQKQIVELGAQQDGNFLVDCETYYSKEHNVTGAPSTTLKKLHVMHNTETPASVYGIVEGMDKSVTLSSDLMFDLLVPRLSHMYTCKKNLKIESKGNRYVKEDWLIKVGTVSMSSGHHRGIIVEVEYLGCVVPQLCWPLLKEFLQSFMGSNAPTNPPQYLKDCFNEIYSSKNTIEQYLERFNELRETNASGIMASSGSMGSTPSHQQTLRTNTPVPT